MAQYSSPDLPITSSLSMLTLFGVGAFVMRGAGCTINDLWDKDFDKNVDRTRTRPLASGQISTGGAIGFLALQLSTGLAILTQLNEYSIVLGVASMLLVSTYPLAKRFTNYPQAVLGLTFNWGALLGWPALLGTQNWMVTLPLYMSGICWTLVYDTIYAHQDKKDDQRVGIKSTARTFGKDTKQILTGLNFLTGISWAFAGYMNSHTMIYYLSVSLASLRMQQLVSSVNLDQPKSCDDAFRKSQSAGWIVSLGIFVDILSRELL